MKYAIFIIFFSGIVFCCKSQYAEARYRVIQQIPYTDPTGKQTDLPFEYTGLLYKNGNQYISFKKPLYLHKYPSGRIDFVYSERHTSSVSIMMDTVQSLHYIHFDSLVWRYRNDRSGQNNVNFNYVRKFETDAKQWEILPETKEINGLKCQKAILKTLDGRLVHEVWFCPDIPMLAGPLAIFNLPGLVVDMKSLLSNERWVLENFTADAVIPAGMFWPGEFNQPFRELTTLKRPVSTPQTTKLEKIKEILDQ